ncbi:splicing factor 3B subunit 1-like isoform X2 [Montipora capricornis]|uniref:splicing factor 3B subunit 1-like isoform X2 n=1 Tax=Montipora capricornis TaxID=246305 RepID=UPI0035F18765
MTCFDCLQKKLMGHLGMVLYEYLGEEYPEVLGSILGALKAIVSVIGMNKMTPPIKDLLSRLTPILKNRVCSIPRGKSEMSTGRSTTACTSDLRMH